CRLSSVGAGPPRRCTTRPCQPGLTGPVTLPLPATRLVASKREIDHLIDEETTPRARVSWMTDVLMGDVPGAEAEHALVLRVVQPALAGLMDGSVSTLAPIFAVAFATQS